MGVAFYLKLQTATRKVWQVQPRKDVLGNIVSTSENNHIRVQVTECKEFRIYYVVVYSTVFFVKLLQVLTSRADCMKKSTLFICSKLFIKR